MPSSSRIWWMRPLRTPNVWPARAAAAYADSQDCAGRPVHRPAVHWAQTPTQGPPSLRHWDTSYDALLTSRLLSDQRAPPSTRSYGREQTHPLEAKQSSRPRPAPNQLAPPTSRINFGPVPGPRDNPAVPPSSQNSADGQPGADIGAAGGQSGGRYGHRAHRIYNQKITMTWESPYGIEP